MGSFEHAITERVQAGDRIIENVKTITGTGRQLISESIPDSTTDGLVAWTLDASQLVSIMIVADQDLTLETNDGSSPTETINLTADVPVLWYTGKPAGDKPIASDVTALYVTNASGAAAQLDIDDLIDATP